MSKVINVRLSDKQKSELEEMSADLKISQTNLINLAVASLLANYNQRGAFIFTDILNADKH